MEYNKMAKQFIDFQKHSFDNMYGAVSILQDQAVSAMDIMLKQSAMVPEDGRNIIDSWVNVCKEERDRFKTYVDKGFVSLEKFITETGKHTEKGRKTTP